MRLASPKQLQGAAIESRAERLLLDHGLVLLARNVHCRMGELDLVMRDGDMLVFVEVRYRRSASRGGAQASVDARKQARIAAAANVFLMRHPRFVNQPCRFDVVAVTGDAPFRFDWVRDAFRL